MGQSYGQLVGNPPRATTMAFRRWYFELLGKRLGECPLARATTYHFDSVGGNDTSGDGSQGSPWQTLTKAQAVVDAWTPGSGGFALLFKRGCEFKNNTALVLNKANITVGAYGSGARPLFNRFVNQYLASGDWSLVGSTHYKRSYVATNVGWTRLMTDRLNPPVRMSSAAEVTAASGRWWYDTSLQELHVNFGANANTLNIEVAGANSTNGVLVTADGCRVDNLRCDGWGMDPAAPGNQVYGIKVATGGTDAAVVSNCESYFASSHALAFYGTGTSGGIATFVNCAAGWCLPSSGGETILNAFSLNGGHEAIFHSCEVAYGTLPAGLTPGRRGGALYGHCAGSATAGLVIVWGLRARDHVYGCNTGSDLAYLPVAAALEEARAFIVDESTEILGSYGGRIAVSNCVRINNRFRVVAGDTASGGIWSDGGLGIAADGWVINGVMDIDLKNVTGNYLGLWNTAVATSAAKFWHCGLLVRGNGHTNFGFDFDGWWGNDVCPGAELRNSVVAAVNMGTAKMRVALNNDATKMINNVYVGVENVSGKAGYGNDPRKIESGDLPALEAEPAEGGLLWRAGDAGLRVEYDERWQPRDPAGPSVGAGEGFYVGSDELALLAHVDSALAEVSSVSPQEVVGALMERAVDGVAVESLLEAMMAVLMGAATRSGSQVLFFKQDGETEKVAVELGEGAGERAGCVISG